MDCSWYNCVGVEWVMGYCSEIEYQQFLCQVLVFEQLLVDDGILLFKYWLCVDQEQQEKCFVECYFDLLKGWKFFLVDLKLCSKYSVYIEVCEVMLCVMYCEVVLWILVDFNDQWLGWLILVCNLLDWLFDMWVDVLLLELLKLKGKLYCEYYDVLKLIEDFLVEDQGGLVGFVVLYLLKLE